MIKIILHKLINYLTNNKQNLAGPQIILLLSEEKIKPETQATVANSFK